MEIKNILAGLVFLIVGAILLVLGIRKKKKCSCKTVGRITGIHECEESDDEGFKHYSYSPEFEYEVNGQIYHGTGDSAYSKRRKIQIGGSINVFYNPDAPMEHYTKGGGIVASLAGLVLMFVGVIYIVAASMA